MSRIDFYHLHKNTLEETLPKLVAKAYETGKNIKIKVGNELRVEFINSLLWTFDEESFLAHGTKKDGMTDLQPIYISYEDDVPNSAKLLFLVDGAESDIEKVSDFERVFYIFNGQVEDELNKARSMFKKFKTNGDEMHYWQQTELGAWKEKEL